MVMSHFINLYLTMVFQYLESMLHTLIVSMLDKPQTSFQIVSNNLFKMVCIKFEYVSEPVYCKSGLLLQALL